MARGATEARVSRLTVGSDLAVTTRPLFDFDWARLWVVAGIGPVSVGVTGSIAVRVPDRDAAKFGCNARFAED
jgi:hypothetical protein